MSVSKNRPIRRLVGWLRQNFPIVKNCVYVYFTGATSPPPLPLLKLAKNIVFVFGLHILYFFTSFLARAYSCLPACAFTLYSFVIGRSSTTDKCHGDICPSDHCNISIRNCICFWYLLEKILLLDFHQQDTIILVIFVISPELPSTGLTIIEAVNPLI